MQFDQRRAFFGEQQDARGFTVQPVHQFQELGLRTGMPQGLDDAETDPAAAVHGHARRLVDGQQRLVFKQDHRLETRPCGHPGFRFLGGPHWRNPHLILGLQPVIRADPPAVDPDLAAAQDTVNMAFRDPFQPSHQVIVDALADRILVNRLP